MMAEHLPGTHYATFGIDATYTGTDGSTTALKARVHRDPARQVERDNRVTAEAQTAEILVMAADLAKPVRGGRFTVEGVEVWTIETTPVLKNGEHICTCSRTGTSAVMARRAQE